MLMQQTVEKLYELHLGGMAKTLQEQLERGDAAGLTFEERLSLLVDQEWTQRQERKVRRRLQLAHLKQPACVEDVDFRHPRCLEKGVFQELMSSRWIQARRNVIITGATGLGKTWLACALANKACRDGHSTLYKRIPRLVEEMAIARADGSFLKMLAYLQRTEVLILDDWGLAPMDALAQQGLLEIIDDRTNIRSTIVTSQMPLKKWHDTIGDPSVADALLDRLLGSATHIPLKGESMRPRKADAPDDSDAAQPSSSRGRR
jgi:DNA replication protein DnaC